MNAGEEKISDFQLMFLITTFILGSVTFISFADTLTKHDTWLVVLAAYAISILFVLSYVFLAKSFPGKNLIQINDIVYGPIIGKFISILYIWFIILLLSLNLNGMADFYTGYIMPETPDLLFLIVCSLACAYAVWKGIESIVKISAAIFFIAVTIVVFSVSLQLGHMDFSNFLPVFDIPLKTFVQGVHTISIIQFCEIMVLLMVSFNLNSYTQIGKHTMLGLAIAAFLMAAISVRNTAVLGITSPIYFSDSYQAFRLIDIGNVLTKMEILFAISLTLVLYIKICILYYATITSISQLFRLKSYRTLILPIGSIAVCLSMTLFDSVVEHNLHAGNYHAILATPFEYVLPPATLLIAKMRGLPRQKRRDRQ